MKRIDVIKAFLENATPCCTPNRSLSVAFGKLYSYATPIAIVLGNTCFIVSRKYSVTTSRHQSTLRNEALAQGFKVESVESLPII